MKTKLLILILCVAVLLGAAPQISVFAKNTDDIIILYENDVHCEVDGYAKLVAVKKELMQSYEHVGVVSSGDFIQGSSLGVVSQGGYIIELMNLVGYDALTLGNHEFDYHLGRLFELVDMMDTKPVCCNFQKIGESESCFEPYSIVDYGDTKVAYIGITTPSTLTSTSTGQYCDEQGNFIYTFHASDLSEVVQDNVDKAISEGADHVIALTHMGDKEPNFNIDELIAAVQGIDVVLDAHSHSVIEQSILKDKAGNDVILSSTGTKFQHIGKLTISGDDITTELISTEEYSNVDEAVMQRIEQINEEYAKLGERKIGVSEVDLITHDKDGNRLVRVSETNLGDLCADMFRDMLDADIGYVNGGGIRAAIKAGDITFNDLLNVMPFNNQPVVIEVTGQNVLDMLELTMINWPDEGGSFPHISGMTFSFNTSIPSSVVLDENEIFVEVAGEYKVYNVRVFNRESGEYEPLDLEKKYSIAGQNHHLTNGGGGMSMFNGAKVLHDSGTLDIELFERYIVERLNGVVGSQYAEVSQSITFTDGVISDDADDTDDDKNDDNDDDKEDSAWVIVVCCVGAAGVALAVIAVVIFKKKARS